MNIDEYNKIIDYLKNNKLSLKEYENYFIDLKQIINNKNLSKPLNYIEPLYYTNVITKTEEDKKNYQKIKLQLANLLKRESFIESFNMISNYNQDNNLLNYMIFKMNYGLIKLSETLDCKDYISKEFINYLMNVDVICNSKYQSNEVKICKQKLENILEQMENKKIK